MVIPGTPSAAICQLLERFGQRIANMDCLVKAEEFLICSS